jgi:cysteine desulfurase
MTVYLDNNATTFMPNNVKLSIVNAMDQGNPSGDYDIAKKSKSIIEATKRKIYDICEIDESDFIIMFNSGASEGNNFLLHSIAESLLPTGIIPHFILSEIEHKTSLQCCERLFKNKLIEYTLIAPMKNGLINPYDVLQSIRPNTVLISIMVANNETGGINDILTITRFIKDNGLPIIFHSDYVQLFGKEPPKLNMMQIDSITVSFHKLYGPQQCGFLIISKRILNRYNLCPMISGSQNDGWRGGTESAFLIAGALAAMNITFHNRHIKNENLMKLKLLLLDLLSIYNIFWFEDMCCVQDFYKNGINIIIYGPKNYKQCLPNTLLFSIVNVTRYGNINHADVICNNKLKDELYKKNIIVSLGSACNKGAASYVLKAMNVNNKQLEQSVIRVSIGDFNSYDDIVYFVSKLNEILLKEFDKHVDILGS